MGRRLVHHPDRADFGIVEYQSSEGNSGMDTFLSCLGYAVLIGAIVVGCLSLKSCNAEDKDLIQERSFRCQEMCGRGSVESFDGKNCKCFSWK